MKTCKLLFLLMILTLSWSLAAKEVSFEKGGTVFSLPVPENYKYYATFMGLENVIMSPEDKELGTSSLSITVTGIQNTKLNATELSVSQKDYRDGRMKYIKERDFEFIEFLPYSLKKNPQGHQIHTVGVIYSTNGESVTVDRSFMIECPQSFIHAKFVGDVGKKKDVKILKAAFFQSSHQQELEKAILRLTCNKK